MKIEVQNVKQCNQIVEMEKDESFYDLVKKMDKENYKKYLAVKVNNKLQELIVNSYNEDDKVKFLDLNDNDGQRIYIRTLCFIYIKACKDIFNFVDVNIEHSLNRGLYTEIKTKKTINQGDLKRIKDRMQEIIYKQMPINKKILSTKEATDIFASQGMHDKVELLKHWNSEFIRVYELDGYYDTFYGYVAPNTNVIDKFDLKLFFPGIILIFPTKENNFELPEYIEQKKLSKVFKEAEDWGEIMDIGNVGVLNNKIVDSTIDDMIRVNEAFHEKKIAYIADEITKDKNIKIVLIAGPSSSGKTTFAQRLSIQLRVNGKKTYALSLDDYFVNRDMTPRDENGDYDYETIGALDLELFNEQLLNLMTCQQVQIPVFNFKIGMREFTREPIELTDDHIIIIEGIHGLNDKLTENIPQKNKFRIYISALTQLNIDNHNRIATSDLRLIRRIVRDNTHRGNDALKTLELWDNVVKGAEKYIFPFQENADAIFNSALVYELCVLKKYAIPLIKKIDEDSEYYPERQRLLKFLSYFKNIDNERAIPYTSILREFIGGSCFE
ncbi:uridine kinase [Sedimentibacter acidaminivorans]|uniref:Uridine kinase n=1 Tax=Sedimentibacter acidaminivorans TaxID=913099 RepID=A0ABS4GCB4_9FIRM|nr:nucleoside kinase [Sedimentibacter acidaminivorans]MBP1925035.1 uridine kinase [Sedimentibacter acidaminivorans]